MLTLSSSFSRSPFPSFSFLLSMLYSHCICWLSLSLCGCFVAKLEPAVSVSSDFQAPAPATLQPQGSLQVQQLSCLLLGHLAGICTQLLTDPFFPIPHIYSITNTCVTLQPMQNSIYQTFNMVDQVSLMFE